MKVLYRGHIQYSSALKEADAHPQFSAWQSRLHSLIWPDSVIRWYLCCFLSLTLHCCQAESLASHIYLLPPMHASSFHWKCPPLSKRLFKNAKACVCLGKVLCVWAQYPWAISEQYPLLTTDTSPNPEHFWNLPIFLGLEWILFLLWSHH